MSKYVLIIFYSLLYISCDENELIKAPSTYEYDNCNFIADKIFDYDLFQDHFILKLNFSYKPDIVHSDSLMNDYYYLKIKNKFNVILNMEVVEHVSNVNLFIQNCSTLIEKNGIMFVATINKNLKSYLYAILGAEYILRWLPIGTHDWEKFLTPQELEIIAIRNNFTMDEIVGMKFNLFSKKWLKSTDASVNYISTFSKN